MRFTAAFHYISETPESTHAFGISVGRAVSPGTCIGLQGDLGAGKTLLTKGLAIGLGISPDTHITSPTFTILNEYDEARAPLLHCDLYRLGDESELIELGLESRFAAGDAIAVVEWCEKFDVLPAHRIQVTLDRHGSDGRKLVVQVASDLAMERATAWHAQCIRDGLHVSPLLED